MWFLKDLWLYVTCKMDMGNEFQYLEVIGIRIRECVCSIFILTNLIAKGCWMFENRVFHANEASLGITGFIFLEQTPWWYL